MSKKIIRGNWSTQENGDDYLEIWSDEDRAASGHEGVGTRVVCFELDDFKDLNWPRDTAEFICQAQAAYRPLVEALRRLVFSADEALGHLNSGNIATIVSKNLCADISNACRTVGKHFSYNEERAELDALLEQPDDAPIKRQTPYEIVAAIRYLDRNASIVGEFDDDLRTLGALTRQGDDAEILTLMYDTYNTFVEGGYVHEGDALDNMDVANMLKRMIKLAGGEEPGAA